MLEYILWSHATSTAGLASVDANSAKSQAREATNTAQRLEMRVATLELAVETMMRIMLTSGRFTEEEFFRMARQVDGEDGVIDGRRNLDRMRKRCNKCSRFGPGDRNACMWCGNDVSRIKPERITMD